VTIARTSLMVARAGRFMHLIWVFGKAEFFSLQGLT